MADIVKIKTAGLHAAIAGTGCAHQGMVEKIVHRARDHHDTLEVYRRKAGETDAIERGIERANSPLPGQGKPS